MITRDDKIKYMIALKHKADDEGISVDEYLDTEDYVIVDKDDHAYYWANDEHDFVVFGDKSEAVEEAQVGDRVMKLTKWLHLINMA